MQYDILIFIQAAADLRFALDIYEKNKGRKIHFCVIHLNLVYDFLKELPIENSTVNFYPYIDLNLKNPFSYIKAKNKLNLFWETDFRISEYKQIYFFSRFYDWFTVGLIGKFIKHKQSEIFYYEHYDDVFVNSDKKLGFTNVKYSKSNIIAKIISYISGVKYTSRYTIRDLEFKYWKYPINKIGPQEVTPVKKEYQYRIEGDRSKNVLFFLSPGELSLIDDSSMLLIIELIQFFKENGFLLILKSHPRQGTPKELKELFDFEIPRYIPAEFISYQNIVLTIGIISTALSYASTIPRVKVISIINLLKFKDISRKYHYQNYLKELSSNKIEFINNKNLTELLKSANKECP